MKESFILNVRCGLNITRSTRETIIDANTRRSILLLRNGTINSWLRLLVILLAERTQINNSQEIKIKI